MCACVHIHICVIYDDGCEQVNLYVYLCACKSMHICVSSSQICLYMVKGVHRSSQRRSYVFQFNADSREGLCGYFKGGQM